MKFRGEEDGEYVLYHRGGWELLNVSNIYETNNESELEDFSLKLPLNIGSIAFTRVREREREYMERDLGNIWQFFNKDKKFSGFTLESNILPNDLKGLLLEIDNYKEHEDIIDKSLKNYLQDDNTGTVNLPWESVMEKERITKEEIEVGDRIMVSYKDYRSYLDDYVWKTKYIGIVTDKNKWGIKLDTERSRVKIKNDEKVELITKYEVKEMLLELGEIDVDNGKVIKCKVNSIHCKPKWCPFSDKCKLYEGKLQEDC